MTSTDDSDELSLPDWMVSAALFAVAPALLGGVNLRAAPGPTRDRWLSVLNNLLPDGAPVRKMPLQVTDDRLFGGLDLSATLSHGRPVVQCGLLAAADGGVVLLAMGERLPPELAARVATVMDTGEVVLERDGACARNPARFGIVVLDEGAGPDERPPPALRERCAFLIDLAEVTRAPVEGAFLPADIAAARAVLSQVTISRDMIGALCSAAVALGVASLRAPLFAANVARISAALHGQDSVDEDDVTLAARLVLAPRATRLPPQLDDPNDPPLPETEEDQQPEDDDAARDMPKGALEDMIIEAAMATLPPDILAALSAGLRQRGGIRHVGTAGSLRASVKRGRPAGTRRGEFRGGVRLDIVETLKAAAPWQPLRRRGGENGQKRVEVRPSDFRIKRFKNHEESLTIFVVDASGSSALHRLAEAKGAVELLLAECYVRRDCVALLAFRGAGTELLLPPTRALARAKRSLSALPGGGGTPLASAIDAAGQLAVAARRRHQTPALVFLTDGQANISRDGSPGRTRAQEDAIVAARAVAQLGFKSLLIDTSPRSNPRAHEIAVSLGARYIALPDATAQGLERAVRSVLGPSGP